MADIAWRKILCPIDFSEESRAALRIAVDLARRFGALLTLLHVREESAPRIVPQDRGGGTLPEWTREAQGEGVPVAAEEIDGDPRVAIAEHAERNGFDLVIMGTHGRTGRERDLAGSVAESTVRTSRIPVLAVHADWPALAQGT